MPLTAREAMSARVWDSLLEGIGRIPLLRLERLSE
jgi:hypothetical protein